MAAKEVDGELVSSGIGIREWLESVDVRSSEAAAAAFDTTLDSPRWLRYFGGAGSKAARCLRRLGFRVVAKPECFWVTGTTGPLLDGEEERARQWGETLATTVTGKRAQGASVSSF
jgi:hypothetical protein